MIECSCRQDVARELVVAGLSVPPHDAAKEVFDFMPPQLETLWATGFHVAVVQNDRQKSTFVLDLAVPQNILEPIVYVFRNA
jgi:hypothetical protein